MAKVYVTAERLREILEYDPLTGIFTWINRTHHSSRVVIGGNAGRVDPDGYDRITIDRVTHKAHRLAWFYVHGQFPDMIDHINGNRRDNRMCNLRVADSTMNNQNRKNNLGFVKRNGDKYISRINITLAGEKLCIYLGIYQSEARAKEVYHAAKLLMHVGYEP